MVTCILLAAGLSERFGSPKALAPLSSTQNVIQQVQTALLQSTCGRIIVVLGAHADKIRPSIFIHSKILVVYNKDYNFGQTSSVQEGWRQAETSSEGIMFLPVDCPLITSGTVDKVIENFKNGRMDILIPTYQGKKGHPPVFHKRLRSEVLGLTKDQGLNYLFTAHPPQTLEINDPGIVKSFNTPEELERIKK